MANKDNIKSLSAQRVEKVLAIAPKAIKLAESENEDTLLPEEYVTAIEEWEYANSRVKPHYEYSLSDLQEIFGKDNVVEKIKGLYEITINHVKVEWCDDFLEDITPLSTVISYDDKDWVDLGMFEVAMEM